MAVLQLISRDRPEGQAELSIVPNPTEQSPDSFEQPPTHPALIGSKDVVLLAAGLCHQGFRVMDAKLVDRFFTPLDDEESEELAGHLVEVVNAADQIDTIAAFMKSELGGCFVGSMRLVDATKKGTVLLQQEGIVITSPSVQPDLLSESMQTAAKWARAS